VSMFSFVCCLLSVGRATILIFNSEATHINITLKQLIWWQSFAMTVKCSTGTQTNWKVLEKYNALLLSLTVVNTSWWHQCWTLIM